MKATLFWLTIFTGPLLAQIEPGAGTWETWIIRSGSQFRLPPPPDANATQAELQTLLAAQTGRDAKALRQITYWNAGAPGYRWRQLISELPTLQADTALRYSSFTAVLSLALYDATIAAWDSKYAHRRGRPATRNNQIKPAIATPDSPSYPCEHAVAAGVAATVLGRLHPQKADSIRQLAQQAAQSRVLAGVAYPSDVEAGFALGQRVAERVLARYVADAPTIWDKKRLEGNGIFIGKTPTTPTLGQRKTLVLTTGSQFRPGPPPDFTRDMAELKAAKRTPQTKDRAYQWAFHDFWYEVVDRKIMEYRLDLNPPRAARAYALADIARQEAIIAFWDAKYAYWGLRPVEMDTTYRPELPTPPFPGYPSGHATFSSAVAVMLAYLFPGEAAYFTAQANEGAESRFDAGVHFRTDNVVGQELGRKVGEAVVKRAKQDGTDERAISRK